MSELDTQFLERSVANSLEIADFLPPTGPGKSDRKKGHFKRFFVQLKRTGEIFEVQKDAFEKFESHPRFNSASFSWRISGPLSDVYNDAGLIEQFGVEDTNRRILEKAESEMRGINQAVHDKTAFWDGNLQDA